MSVVLAKSALAALLCAATALGGGCTSSRGDKLSELEEKVVSLEANLSETRSACDAAVARAQDEAYADCRVLLESLKEANWQLQERIWELQGTKPYSFRIRSAGLIPSDRSILLVDVALRRPGGVPDEYVLRMANAILSEIATESQVRQVSFYFWSSEQYAASGEGARACVEWGADSGKEGEAKLQWEEEAQSLRLVFNETGEPISSAWWHSPRLLLFIESDRQQIFTDLVKRQDEVQGDPDYPRAMEEAKEEIARKYSITVDELNDIILEGLIERWTLPPPPGRD
jgi:outer membrane murein-binding lipoprotein Lpp